MVSMTDRGQTRVYLSRTAKDEVGKLAQKIGISQAEMLSRLCEWFAVQPKGERLRILGILEEGEDVTDKPEPPKQNSRKTG